MRLPINSTVCNTQDTLKISGIQVSPTEIEDTLLAHPSQPPLISDVAVAGVMTPDSRLSDEQVPRAWVVLTEEGRKLGAEEVIKRLDAWHKEALSKYKWLRGGFGIVDQASDGHIVLSISLFSSGLMSEH